MAKYFWRDYEITGAVGVIKPLIGSTTVSFKSVFGTGNANQQASDLKKEAESDFDSALLTKIFIPTVTVAVVKRF